MTSEADFWRTPDEARIADLRKALRRIAFQEDVNGLSGDPSKWPSTIAYDALGGRYESGRRVDNSEDLE